MEMGHQGNPPSGSAKPVNSTLLVIFIIVGILQIALLIFGFSFPFQVISIILNLIGLFYTITQAAAPNFPSIRSIIGKIPRSVNIAFPIILFVLLVISLGANYLFFTHRGSQPSPTPTSAPSNGVTQTAINARVTPSPTPKPRVITKNLLIPCTTCQNNPFQVELVLNSIRIEDANQDSIWNFTLTSTGIDCSDVHFVRLELQDDIGQQHEGTGLASNSWAMSSGQSLPISVIFNVVPQQGTTYILNATLECESGNDNVYQTESFTF